MDILLSFLLTQIVGIVIGLAAGFAVGAWWYRYTLKRDPAKLERFAQQINDASAKIPPELAAVINALQVKVKALEEKK